MARPHVLVTAQAQAQGLPPLLVDALRTAATLTFGAHGRGRSGPGDSFYQYRHYEPGESAHRIDWRASARSEHTYVRETEWEAAQTVLCWVDGSPSMHWRSSAAPVTKYDRAMVLTLAASALLLEGSELVGPLNGSAVPARDPATLLRLYNTLTHAHTENVPPLGALPRRAHVLVVGDFLPQAPALADWLGRCSSQGAQVVLVEVADPAEETFPYSGPTLFRGLEGEGTLDVTDPRTLRQTYLSRRQQARALLTDTARRCNAHYLTHLTSQEPAAALQQLYRHLAPQRGHRSC